MSEILQQKNAGGSAVSCDPAVEETILDSIGHAAKDDTHVILVLPYLVEG